MTIVPAEHGEGPRHVAADGSEAFAAAAAFRAGLGVEPEDLLSVLEGALWFDALPEPQFGESVGTGGARGHQGAYCRIGLLGFLIAALCDQYAAEILLAHGLVALRALPFNDVAQDELGVPCAVPVEQDLCPDGPEYSNVRRTGRGGCGLPPS